MMLSQCLVCAKDSFQSHNATLVCITFFIVYCHSFCQDVFHEVVGDSNSKYGVRRLLYLESKQIKETRLCFPRILSKSLTCGFVFYGLENAVRLPKFIVEVLKGLTILFKKFYLFSWSKFACKKGFDASSGCYKFSVSSRPTPRVTCRRGLFNTFLVLCQNYLCMTEQKL